jgi:hypothetical protein
MLLNLNIYDNYSTSLLNYSARHNILNSSNAISENTSEKEVLIKQTSSADLSQVREKVLNIRNMYKRNSSGREKVVFIICIELHGAGDEYVCNGQTKNKEAYIKEILEMIYDYIKCARIFVLDSSCSDLAPISNSPISLKVASRIKLMLDNADTYYTDLLNSYEMHNLSMTNDSLRNECVCHIMIIRNKPGCYGKWFVNTIQTIHDRTSAFSSNDGLLYYMVHLNLFYANCHTIRSMIEQVNKDLELNIELHLFSEPCTEMTYSERIIASYRHYVEPISMLIPVKIKDPEIFNVCESVRLLNAEPRIFDVDFNEDHFATFMFNEVLQPNAMQVNFPDDLTSLKRRIGFYTNGFTKLYIETNPYLPPKVRLVDTEYMYLDFRGVKVRHVKLMLAGDQDLSRCTVTRRSRDAMKRFTIESNIWGVISVDVRNWRTAYNTYSCVIKPGMNDIDYSALDDDVYYILSLRKLTTYLADFRDSKSCLRKLLLVPGFYKFDCTTIIALKLQNKIAFVPVTGMPDYYFNGHELIEIDPHDYYEVEDYQYPCVLDPSKKLLNSISLSEFLCVDQSLLSLPLLQKQIDGFNNNYS